MMQLETRILFEGHPLIDRMEIGNSNNYNNTFGTCLYLQGDIFETQTHKEWTRMWLIVNQMTVEQVECTKKFQDNLE